MSTENITENEQEEVKYDMSICFTGTLSNYVITSIILATIGLLMQTTTAILCLVEKRYSKSSNIMIMVNSLCSSTFVTFYTMTYLLQQASHCGWTYLNDTSCKLVWWLRHFSFVLNNYFLLFSSHETNPHFLGKKPKQNGKPRKLVLLILLTIFQVGVFTSHYLVLEVHHNEKTTYKGDVIQTGYCTVDQRHTVLLQIVEFIVGTILPVVLILFNFVYCLAQKAKKLLSNEKTVIPQQESKRSQMERKISSRTNLVKKTPKRAENLTYWISIFGLTIFLFIPQRMLEFVLFIKDNQKSGLTIGLENRSDLNENTWRVLLIVVGFSPVIYGLFVLPLYCFLTEQGQIFFKCLFGGRKYERGSTRPIQRQRPIRKHVSTDVSLRRCYSISDRNTNTYVTHDDLTK